ncbi:hypothetical protein [Roseomonas sp. USHLN139]|uniref:hypothetical protein n=1 Tax=Roseomonas sp. USHLN139 TaxID=3081298 RepID=UPI003B022F49
MPGLRRLILLPLLAGLAACAGVSTRSLEETPGPAIAGEGGDPAGRPHRGSPRSLQESLFFRF